MSCIYLLYFEDDNLPFYVGYTSRNSDSRLYEHNFRVLFEYGKKAKIVELEHLSNDDQNEAWKSVERKWIKFFRSFCLLENRNSGGSCYPISASILGGRSNKGKHPRRSSVSKETKIKISNAQKGRSLTDEQKAKRIISMNGKRSGMQGKKHSDKSKIKMSSSHKGLKSGMLGKRQSDKAKLLISKANKNKKLTEGHKRNIKTSWVIRKFAKDMNIPYHEAKAIFNEGGKRN